MKRETHSKNRLRVLSSTCRGVITVLFDENNLHETPARNLYSNRRTARLQSLSTFYNIYPSHDIIVESIYIYKNNNKLCRYNISETKVRGGLTSIPKKAEGARSRAASIIVCALYLLVNTIGCTSRFISTHPFQTSRFKIMRECRRVKRTLKAIRGDWAIRRVLN